MDAPPPPPPHGARSAGPKSGGLPDGKYDIFVIPPSSAGAGFLYLPSLQTHRNSFLAGVACTATTFFIWSIAVPAIKDWFAGILHGGGPGFIMFMLAVGIASWAWGKTQGEGEFGGTPGGPGTGPSPGTRPSWQRTNPQANAKDGANTAKSNWEKAREETRKKEEERRRTDDFKKRREELEKERQKQREKDAKERIEREQKEKRERGEKATSGVGAAKDKAEHETKEKERGSPKKPPNPSARTENEDDAYSFRPYDRPKKAAHKANSAASIYSESSYAPSATTAKTTPPPSSRGPYATKDPDKIIIKAVYMFNNAFMRTPISQLISGQGNVTDGLILRITTEGLFIDDDVRGVPQREWDIKAWTMKLAEVWCPISTHGPLDSSALPRRKFSPFSARGRTAAARRSPYLNEAESTALVNGLLKRCAPVCRKAWDAASASNASMCSPSSASSSYFTSSPSTSTASTARTDTDETLTQSCEMMGLHVLRASIRDQEGKKYVFILSQSEGWKVAIGLQRLRRGTQVRALGVSGLPQNETKALIENLGWG